MKNDVKRQMKIISDKGIKTSGSKSQKNIIDVRLHLTRLEEKYADTQRPELKIVIDKWAEHLRRLINVSKSSRRQSELRREQVLKIREKLER